MAASGTISTAAPICGVPVESRTTPESLPAAAPAGAADVFAPIKKHVSVRMRAPRVRRRSCLTGHYFPGIFPRSEGGERQQTFDSDLFAGLLHLFGSFLELHDLLVALLYRVLEGGAGLMRFVVGLEVVNLHVDAELFVGREFAV